MAGTLPLQVTVRRLHRRVRKKWCFYPHNGTRYDLHYIQGSPPSLTRTGSQGSEATAVRAKPVVGVAEVLGWGLLRDQREVLTWDMLRFPNFGNASVDSWVVTQGGRMQPMDPLEPDHSHSPVGHHYVDYLRIGMCTFGPIEQGVKFREIYTDSPQVCLCHRGFCFAFFCISQRRSFFASFAFFLHFFYAPPPPPASKWYM